MNPGEKIQYLRKYILKWNQAKFAIEVFRKSKAKGLYQELISKYETGKEEIREQHLEAFALFFAKRYKANITKHDLEACSIAELIEKMEGKTITPNNSSDNSKSLLLYNRKKLIPFLLLLLISFLAYHYFKSTTPPTVKIHYPNNAQKLVYSNIPVTGSIVGSRNGFELWLFIERKGVGDIFFWPKSEVDVYKETIQVDSLAWEREIYHHPSPSDTLLYDKQFSISLFVIPKNKLKIINSWFKNCKEIGHYPPLDNISANEVIQFRRAMISGLKLQD